ncbi:MAG TPA: multicopper oxidase domain-containing protein [Candidatus Angelobacter sp.]|nr:multicopper oxidase domain-containing protein [Candidatus Angelobacter sp.]
MNRRISVVLTVFAVLLLALPAANLAAQTVAPVANPCPRLAAGSVVSNPAALFSQNGVLNVQFSYQSVTDSVGRQLFCFMTPDGLENPTLHVKAGDTLNVTVTNNTPFNDALDTDEPFNAPNCGDTTFEQQVGTGSSGFAMSGGSMNIHYHGTNTTPACHGDNVVKTLVNPGNTFQYSLQFPTDEPPGLYWYHPHVHGLAELALLGGGRGALVVDGIENVQPAVSGMDEQIFVIGDQAQVQGLGEGPGNCGVNIPFQDLVINNVSIDSNATVNSKGQTTSITFTPAVVHMGNGPQFWRVSNSTADTILDLQVLYDGVPQTLQVVGIDAVPVNSQDGTAPGQLIPVTDYRLAVAGRVEFIVQPPSSSVKVAQFITNNVNTGPQGDCDPTRAIANIVKGGRTASADNTLPVSTGVITAQRFGGLGSATVTATRTFQFSEVQPTEFFITQVSAGQPPTLFDNNNPPAVITTQGSVEHWNVQNIAQENHEFHQHQIHFLVLEQDNYEINGNPQNHAMNGQFADMIEVPFWTGKKSTPLPTAQLLMDFRGPDVGDFVYHCHILSHEDLGMMAIERVCPQTGCTQ